MNFALMARRNYIPHFGLLSSKAANIESIFDSVKLRGRLERDIKDLKL